MVAVVLKHQQHAHHLEYHEDKPVVVFLEKRYKIAHGEFLISSGTNISQRS